jgi:hypothetical protein
MIYGETYSVIQKHKYYKGTKVERPVEFVRAISLRRRLLQEAMKRAGVTSGRQKVRMRKRMKGFLAQFEDA